MRRLLVAGPLVGGGTVALGEVSAHHARVLRLAVGERLVVFDGAGQECDADLLPGDHVALVGDPRTSPSRPALVALVSVLKGPAMDDAVRMATEAGATAIWPIGTARSVPTSDRGDRWRRIAEEAARQSGRATVPVVDDRRSLAQGLVDVPRDYDRRIAAPGGERLAQATGPAAVLVGPEGGFDANELSSALAAGWRPMALGPHILRASTAAALAVAMTAASDDGAARAG